MTAYVSLLIILAAVGFLLYLLLPWPMATKLLRPRRMTEGRALALMHRISPADVGLDYEETVFRIRDEQTGGKLEIAGWWMRHPAGGDRTAILVHGYGDAKVGALAWAPLMQSLGYDLLAIDLRAHGKSGGRDTTGGYWEREDLSQVIDELKHDRPRETRHLVLFGVSLGAAVVAATAVRRDDVDAAILDSPFADYPSAVLAHANLMGMPGPSFVRRAIKRAEKISGADFAEVAPVKTVAEARCPVMVIAAGDDPLIGEGAEILEEVVRGRGDGSVYWRVEGAYHVECMKEECEGYRGRIAEFLEAAGERGRDEATAERENEGEVGMTKFE